MAWYRAGTATFTNGSTAVAGSGTAWATNVRPGDEIIGPDNISREVETVTSDTALTMVETYAGSTAAGAAYKVKPIQGWNRDVAAQLAALINDYGSVEAALTVLAGNLGLGKSPNAGAKLDVAGQVWVDAPSGDATLRMLTSGAEKGKLAVTSAGRVYIESNGAEVMTLLNGNVGIGTGVPARKLEVSGPAIRVADAAPLVELFSAGVVSWSISANRAGASEFQVVQDSTERMRIDSSGNFMIGKTTAENTNPGCYFEPAGALGYGRLNFVKGAASGTGATQAAAFYYAGSSVGRLDVTSTSLSLVNSSDRRLKTNIQPAPEPGGTLDSISVVSYDWRAGGSVSYGFVAQDLHVVFPEAVSPGDETLSVHESPWCVDYSRLVPLLVKEIQGLRARVSRLEAVSAK